MYKTVIIYDKGEILNNVKEEFYKKFDGKAKAERKAFAFGQGNVISESTNTIVNNDVANVANAINVESTENTANEGDNVVNTTVNE